MSDFAVRFALCCKQETAVLEALLSLLEEEQSAIIRFDAYVIDSLAEKKQDALSQLLDCKQRRLSHCEEAGLHEQEHFMQWLAAESPEAQRGWVLLEHALARVQALNNINADMARERVAFADATLDALRREAQQIDGYGRHGTFAAASTPSSRRLGSA